MNIAVRLYTKAPQAICFFVFLLASWTAPLLGQIPAKKILKPEEFNQWSELGGLNISNNGKWGSVHLFSENGPDTLKVLSTAGHKVYTFPNSSKGIFSADGKWLVFKNNHKEVGILNLETGAIKYIIKGKTFSFSKNGKLLAIKVKPDNPKAEDDLILYRLEKGDSLIVNAVSQYKFNPMTDEMLYVNKENAKFSLALIQVKSWEQTHIATRYKEFKNLLWSENGKTFFFIENDSVLCNGTIGESIKIKRQSLISKSFQKIHPGVFQPFFSKDGNRIFFYMQKENKAVTTTDTLPSVQIWQGTDKWIYPRTNMIGSPGDWQMLYSWEPAKNRIQQIGSAEKPNVVITPNSDYALRYNIIDYEPEYLQFPTVDIYLKNLDTNAERLLIVKQQTGSGYVQISPSGKQICFFNGRDWINYNLQTEVFTNMTVGINSFFYNNESDTPEPSMPYGIVGWTTGDKGIVVYDKYDIWYISYDGKIKNGITKGRETKTTYRVAEKLPSSFPRGRFPKYNGKEIDLTKDIVLSVKNENKSSGYVVLKTNGDMVDFAISLSKTSGLQKAKDSNDYIFIKETASTPPQVFTKKSAEKNMEMLYQSNPQYKNYRTGKRELIIYDSGIWKNLNGILYYPDNYDASKKYPMITKIYEVLSNKFYDYIAPSLHLRDGYNVRNFTAAGYFVLEPDIRYRIGDPGVSAVECVTAAVGKVLKRNEVDKNRLGLIGHSFGGYESAFIIGQTNIFKAAVAGAPIIDMLSYYLSINSDEGVPQMWHIENQQERMGRSYFQASQAYRRNSPIEHANSIQTPLLLWEGNQDRNVHWFQSIEMYLALRRLKKKVIFYVYPGEAHDIDNLENQKDLSLKIMEWFDSYLK